MTWLVDYRSKLFLNQIRVFPNLITPEILFWLKRVFTLVVNLVTYQVRVLKIRYGIPSLSIKNGCFQQLITEIDISLESTRRTGHCWDYLGSWTVDNLHRSFSRKPFERTQLIISVKELPSTRLSQMSNCHFEWLVTDVVCLKSTNPRFAGNSGYPTQHTYFT